MSQYKSAPQLIIATLIAPLCLAACAGSGGASSSGGAATSASSTSGGGSGSGTAVVAESQNIQGNWSGCETQGSESSQATLSVGATSYSLSAIVYGSTSCSGSALATISASGTYSVGAASTTVSGATNLTLSANSSVTITPQSSVAVLLLNNQSLCGLSTWKVNTPQTISTSNSCLSSLDSSLLTNAAEIYEVESSTLYLGNTANTAINTSFGLKKQ